MHIFVWTLGDLFALVFVALILIAFAICVIGDFVTKCYKRLRGR